MTKMLEDLAEVLRKIKRVPSNFEDGTAWGDENRFACHAFMQNHHATITDMTKRLAAAERDAARYRWLIEHLDGDDVGGFDVTITLAPELQEWLWESDELDKAIDAAMQESGE